MAMKPVVVYQYVRYDQDNHTVCVLGYNHTVRYLYVPGAHHLQCGLLLGQTANVGGASAIRCGGY